jgi:hypothetical protein
VKKIKIRLSVDGPVVSVKDKSEALERQLHVAEKLEQRLGTDGQGQQ